MPMLMQPLTGAPLPEPSLGALAAAVKLIANTMRVYIDATKDGKGGGLAALPRGLAPVLRALCVHSTPRVAKAAALALAGACAAVLWQARASPLWAARGLARAQGSRGGHACLGW